MGTKLEGRERRERRQGRRGGERKIVDKGDERRRPGKEEKMGEVFLEQKKGGK